MICFSEGKWLYYQRVDLFSDEDALNIARILEKTHLQNLVRFSFSTYKSRLTDRGMVAVLDSLYKAPLINNLHVTSGATIGMTDDIFPHLIKFLDAKKETMIQFECSFMW